MVFSTLTIADIWRSIGLELLIFFVTLGFALIIRTNSGKKVLGKLGKDIEGSGNSSYTRPAASTSKGAAQDFSPSTRPGRSGPNSGERQERAADRRPLASAGSGKDAGQIMDEVVTTMQQAPSTRSANKALALYADMQMRLKDIRIHDAAKRSSHTAVEFYTTLVQCAIRVGKHHLVESIIDEMSKQQVPRPLNFYESAMKQFAGQKHYHLALNMYDRLIADGLEPSAVTCSCLISFAAEVGELQRAVSFFQKLSSLTTPSIRACMTVLRVHAKRQDWPSSLATYRDMQKRGVKLDSLVLNVILATGVAADQIEAVEKLLLEAEGLRPPISDVVSYNTLIKGYAQRNDYKNAVQVLTRMRQQGLATNAISFNTAMDSAVRCSQNDQAWELLQDMRCAGFRPDKFTCSILIKGLGKAATAVHMRKSLDLLKEVDATCDATLRSTLYHSVLESAAQALDTTMLMATFTQMRYYQVSLTTNAYRILVQALGQEGDMKKCNQIFQQMLKEEIRPQASIFIALLESHLRQGQVEGALAAFESLRQTILSQRQADKTSLLEECRVAFIRSLCRIPREAEATQLYLQASSDGALSSIDSATGMMLARAQSDAGSISNAWSTIEDMMGLGHKPNEATIHAFLNACIKQSHTVYAKALLQKCAEHDLPLSQASTVLLLKLYGRCQHLEDALNVFENVCATGADPAPQTVVALLRVCANCRQVAKGLEVLEKLQERTPETSLDGSIYRVALSCCATAGMVAKGIDLAESVLKRGAMLPEDALEPLAAATVSRRGGNVASSSAEMRRLQSLAETHQLRLLPPEASPLKSVLSSSVGEDASIEVEF